MTDTKENVSKKQIAQYLDLLVKNFGLQNPVPEKALTILFNAKLYNECIKEIKDNLRLACGLKVFHHEDTSFPDRKAEAVIRLLVPMPLYGSKSFDDLSLELHLRKSLQANYYKFMYCIAHEMSHIVLHGTKHALYESEVATDLFVMVYGFESIMAKGRKGCGYLTDKNFEYAQKYLEKIRKRKAFLQKINTFFRKFKAS
jgi:hypothetical protein